MDEHPILTTEEQLDMLPERSAVRSRYGHLAEKGPDGRWYVPPLKEPARLKTLLVGGARVLDLGAWPDQHGYPAGGKYPPSPDELAAMLAAAVAKRPTAVVDEGGVELEVDTQGFAAMLRAEIAEQLS